MQDENIPVGVFDYAGSLDPHCGDFFKGLSDEADPTVGLPSTDVSVGDQGDLAPVDGGDRAAVDKGKRPVGCVPSLNLAESTGVPWKSPVVNIIDEPEIGDKVGREAFPVEVCSSRKPVSVTGEGDCGKSTGKRSRPKKLVPSRNVGMLTREQVRRRSQVVHTSSSEDEYEQFPDTEEKRRRVGFFFRTAPYPLLPDFLTGDDQWKLEGCSLQKRVKRAERVAGLVCVY